MGNSGWNRPNPASQPKKKSGAKAPSIRKGIVAGLVVVIVLALAGWLLFPGDSVKPIDEVKTRRKIADNGCITRKVVASNDVAVSKQERIRQYRSALNEQVKEFVTKSPTNAIRWVNPPLDPADPDNILETQTSRDIATLLAIRPGEHIPEVIPFGFMFEDTDKAAAAAEGEDVSRYDGGNKDFLSSLKKWQVVIKESDSDDMAGRKQQLFEGQLELIKGIDEGLTVNDSIKAAYEFRVRAAETRDSLIEMVATLAREENSPEITDGLIKKANETLDAKGIIAIEKDEVADMIESLNEANEQSNEGESDK